MPGLRAVICSTSPPASPLPLPDPNPVSATVNSHIDDHSLRTCIRQIFRTPRNIFGLIRQYYAERLPLNDPEELVTLEDLSTPSFPIDSSRHPPLTSVNTFYPYPNENSFRLGHWYWNAGVQKSQQGFKDLVAVVGDPCFEPKDVRDTKWDEINTILGDNIGDTEEGWKDEDAGWKTRQIQILVPFHYQMKSPGARDFVGAELHHRSLVEVIKERITDPHTAAHFHMEPFELLWKPTEQHNEVKMHGEIYTSEAFLQAHRTLQESPGEPNCDLPKVVVALMFWSDVAHLTSFGNSHLWPCYLFLGNESKYRRCKPSCNLCSHIAYFQKVG